MSATLKQALKLSSDRQADFAKARRFVHQSLFDTPYFAFSTPVILDMFDGKVATYRVKGDPVFKTMVVK